MRQTKALSLIEVVASLVLLATTATGLLAAHGKSLEQLAATRRQETAAILARQLVTAWKIDPPAPVSTMEGRLEGNTSWRWTQTMVPYSTHIDARIQEMTVTIYHTDERGNERCVAAYSWLERLDVD